MEKGCTTMENIKKVGEEWGTAVCLDKLIEEGKSFSNIRVLIDTCVFQLIEEWVYMSIGGRRYDIYVKEIRCEVYGAMCFPMALENTKSLPIEYGSTNLENL